MKTKKLQIHKETLRPLDDAAAATVAGGLAAESEACPLITSANSAPCVTTHPWD